MKTFVIDAYLDNCIVLPEHTFGLTVIDAIRYVNWMAGKKVYDFVLCDRVFTTSRFDYLTNDHVPVGGVGFVLQWLRGMGIDEITPLNIPQVLWEKCRRSVCIASESELSGRYMSKSVTVIKDPTNGPICCPTSDRGEPRFLTGWVDGIIGEWRCFVYDRQLVGIQNYSGDPFIVPDKGYIESVINVYPGITYTLDVMVYANPVHPNGKPLTDILELHEFFACALFGFADYETLLQMHVAAIDDILASRIQPTRPVTKLSRDDLLSSPSPELSALPEFL